MNDHYLMALMRDSQMLAESLLADRQPGGRSFPRAGSGPLPSD